MLNSLQKQKKIYEDQELLKRTINYVYVLFVYYNIYKYIYIYIYILIGKI